MNEREKLIELVDGAINLCISTKCSECIYIDEVTDKDPLYRRNCQNKLFADHLISNGVTVGVEAKPLKQYLTQIDEYAGLKLKFLVFKADTGERIENCFVLRPDKDRAAVEALRAYAEATDNKTLAEDIYSWVGNGVTVQKWIPVSERLPQARGEVCKNVNLLMDDGLVTVGWLNENTGKAYYLDTVADYVMRVPISRCTYWMPLPPEPPKECE